MQVPLPAPTASAAPSPVSAAPTATTANSVIFISQANKIFFDQTPVGQDQIGDFLKAQKASNQDLKLSVKVDRNASPDILSTVMDAGASAGFGVLPYSYAAASDSMPPGPSHDVKAVTSPAASTPAASSDTSTTNAAPLTNPNADGTPPTPAPLQPQ
jgi:hypothetical protein